MIKKLHLLLMLIFSFVGTTLVAQVTGTVTSDTGEPLIGVNVVVKGTSTGTITDYDGKYSVEAKEGSTLVFSYIGYGDVELVVGTSSVMDVTMSEGENLNEVVVTALGISREKKSLGYAVQEVSGEALNKGNQSNIVNGLSGRISGIQVQNSRNIGGSSRIVVRGSNSLLGNNQPLFIVDGVPIDNSNYGSGTQAYGSRDDTNGNVDYGNAAQDINPNDIESYTVLKGANAAALYGSRAANGVILITTKKGKQKEGVKVTANLGGSINTAYDFPQLQNEYGGGRSPFQDANSDGIQNEGETEFAIGDDGIPYQNVTTDESWGPKLNGQMVRQWDGFGGGGEVRPWVAHPDNYKNFFETGVSTNNSFAIDGKSKLFNYRLSYTNLRERGTIPNSELDRNSFSFNANTKINKWSFGVSANYVNTQGQGKPRTGGSSDNLSYNLVIWTQRQLDIERLKQYENADGSQHTWRTSGLDLTNVRANNPYWLSYKDVQDDETDRLYGNVSAKYQINDKLSFLAKIGQDGYNTDRRTRRAVGSRYTPYFINENIDYKQINADAQLAYESNFGENISFNGILGVNSNKRNFIRKRRSTSGGLVLSDIYTIENSVDPYFASTTISNRELHGVYGTVSFGYKSFLYLDATARNDWSSTLPSDNRSYFYPSVTGSVILSELMDKNDILSYAKIRLGWAQVGLDADPYRLNQTYSLGLPVGGQSTFRLPSSLNNANLKPEITTSSELGFDLKFLNNRLGLDFTLYSSSSKNQILPIQVSPTTGYSTKWINAGEIQNKGVELSLNASVVKKKNFNWDMNVNWAKNTNEVVEFDGDLDSYLVTTFYSSGNSKVYLRSDVGKPLNSIYATTIATNENGDYLINSDGTYMPTDTATYIGSVAPDWTGGVYNSFSYKGFRLGFLVDFQSGGNIFLRGYQTALYAGTLIETTENNIREDGIVLDGVLEDGSVNTTSISSIVYNRLKRKTGGTHTVFDASFIKLRQISFGYDFPTSITDKIGIGSLRASVVAQNVAILARNTPDGYDPESAGNTSGNLQGREYGQLPQTRNIGLNLNITF